MSHNYRQLILAFSFVLAAAGISEVANAQVGQYRQSYGSWSYHSNASYYYTSYYYKPVATYPTYSHHYCIYYPTRPRYVYYYNPVQKVYWGRYDFEKKGYSLLAKEDRKAKLDDIPDKAFPKPAEMPFIPESRDKTRMKPIDPKTLPKADAPQALPAG